MDKTIENATRHMTEEEDFKPERDKTAEMTWLSDKEIKKLLENYTHSEIRMWTVSNSGVFIPWDFEESLFRKKECKNIPIINAVGEIKRGKTLIINSAVWN